MSDATSKDPSAYILKVREGTHRYAQELFADNERLRSLVASLEAEMSDLSEDLAAARESADRHRVTEAHLKNRLQGIEEDSKRSMERFAEVEQQNANLASLYVASHRLHGTLDREEVMAAIREIVANLIGSEEMGVFELRPDGSGLDLIGHNGLDPQGFKDVPANHGILGKVVATGCTHVTDRDGIEGAGAHDAHLTAGVPLRVDGDVQGVIGIYRMLPQKPQIAEADHELLELLATQAGMALYCTRLHARFNQGGSRG